MNKAEYFIHLSGYETFSVVCAEALCCGTPVIASNVGAISELVDNTNGILIQNNNVSNLLQILEDVSNGVYSFNRGRISDTASKKFAPEYIGKKYFDTLKEIANK